MFKWLTLIFAVALVSSFVSMMAAFVGSQGVDLKDLLVLQTVLVPLAIAVIVWCFSSLLRRHRFSEAFRKFWDRLPGWLVFAVVAANSLVLITELAFVLVQYHTGARAPWQEHLPAATAFFSSLAMATCYVNFRLAEERDT